jgi:hypothetical protein
MPPVTGDGGLWTRIVAKSRQTVTTLGSKDSFRGKALRARGMFPFNPCGGRRNPAFIGFAGAELLWKVITPKRGGIRGASGGTIG